jgi:nitroreductase
MEVYKMNETLKVLETRRSCRNFDKEKMVSEEDLQAILKAGTYAATGMGKQSPIIIAVTNKELRDELSKENARIMGVNSDPFYGAPVILIVLANKEIGTYIYDGSLVMGNLMNAAESLGLGSVWIHRAKEEFESDFGKKILADLGIEGNYEGIGHCALGYAAAPANAPAPRKDNYVYYIK